MIQRKKHEFPLYQCTNNNFMIPNLYEKTNKDENVHRYAVREEEREKERGYYRILLKITNLTFCEFNQYSTTQKSDTKKVT